MTRPKDIVRDGYDKVSHAYRRDTFDPAENSPYRECLDLLLPKLASGACVLDLGCGCGVPVARELSDHHSVTGIDISPVQIARARSLVPDAEFLCADMATLELPEGQFDAIVSFYAIIHVPLEEQRPLFGRIAAWLREGGWLLCTVGQGAWTGTESNWLGVPGGTMYWSHADKHTYRRWLMDLGFRITREAFIPEGEAGHVALLAQKQSDGSRRSTSSGSL